MKGNVNPDAESLIQLTRKQESAIAALLSEATLKEAASKVGVTETTLWRWQQEEAFSKAYMEARRLATSQALARIQQAGSKAVDALLDVVDTAIMHPPARVAAAKAILDYAIKGVELDELKREVEELKALIKEGK